MFWTGQMLREQNILGRIERQVLHSQVSFTYFKAVSTKLVRRVTPASRPAVQRPASVRRPEQHRVDEQQLGRLGEGR